MQYKTIGIISLCISVFLYFFGVAEKETAKDEEGAKELLTVQEISKNKEQFATELRGVYSEHPPESQGIVEVELVAIESNGEIISGKKTPLWTYGDRVPGEEIRLTYGETLRATFTNKLSQPTTIHWHGVRVPSEMDGVPGISQEPVQPGETFIYEFTPKDAGTFWFHSHVDASEQVERGLYGTLVVEEQTPIAEYDRDVVLVLDDWLLQEEGTIYDKFNTGHDLMHDGRWGNVVTVNATQEYSLQARPGEWVRLRLVNSSNGRVYMPDFTGVPAKLLAFDGMPIRFPFTPQDLVLAPGNRADVLIMMPTQRGQENIVIYDRFTNTDFPLFNISISGAPMEKRLPQKFDRQQVPLWYGADALPVDHSYTLDVQAGGPLGIAWTINGKIYDSEAQAITLMHDTFNKIRFENASARIHPMHLHGQFFKVISRSGIAVDEAFFRDTVLIGPEETVDIGLVPRDRGTWVQHCHILEHAEAGMMSKIIVE